MKLPNFLGSKVNLIFVVLLIVTPLIEKFCLGSSEITSALTVVLIFSLLGFALNIITGYCGILHLGIAGFMAIGAYSTAILTSNIYPFQFGFWSALICGALIAAAVGALMSLPTLRLRGDYFALVTLGFGEIVQDILRNFEVITKGQQGISPLPHPTVFGKEIQVEGSLLWYVLVLAVVLLVLCFSIALDRSLLGTKWRAVRENELAALASGVSVVQLRVLALTIGSSLAGLAGALYVIHLSSSGEPGNYDFTVSILALCMVIVGGLGNSCGVLIGALLVVGTNSVLLQGASRWLSSAGLINSNAVLLSPGNWKYLLFGVLLVVFMRLRP